MMTNKERQKLAKERKAKVRERLERNRKNTINQPTEDNALIKWLSS
jgi:hypothetical protein